MTFQQLQPQTLHQSELNCPWFERPGEVSQQSPWSGRYLNLPSVGHHLKRPGTNVGCSMALCLERFSISQFCCGQTCSSWSVVSPWRMHCVQGCARLAPLSPVSYHLCSHGLFGWRRRGLHKKTPQLHFGPSFWYTFFTCRSLQA